MSNSNRDDRRGYNCHMNNDNDSTNRTGSRGDHNNRRRDYDRMSSSSNTRNRSMSDADIERSNDNKRYRRGDFQFNDIFLNMALRGLVSCAKGYIK